MIAIVVIVTMVTTLTVTTVDMSATGAGIMYMHTCTVPFRRIELVYSPLEPGIPLESGVVVSGPEVDDAVSDA